MACVCAGNTVTVTATTLTAVQTLQSPLIISWCSCETCERLAVSVWLETVH